MTAEVNNEIGITLAGRIVETLENRGVARIFGVPGGGSSLDLIDAAAKKGIEFVLCRTESAAAIMAAVTGELTGIPGVVLTGIGPGTASVINGVAYASLERAPLIVFTDAHDADIIAPPHQIFDQPSLFSPISKAQERLSPRGGADSFERLFELAAEVPSGPVHIDLSSKDAGSGCAPPTARQPVAAEPLDPSALKHASELIGSAKRPVLIVGHQCRSKYRAAAANALANTLAAPTFTTYKGKGIIPESGPLNVGLYTGANLDNTVLERADLIIFCGVDPVEMIPGKWPHEVPTIVLTEVANLAWPFEPTVEIQGAAADSASLVARFSTASEWTSTDITAQKKRLQKALTNRATEGRSPDEIIDAVADSAPANARLAIDAGAHMFSALTRWPSDAPHGVLKSNGLSTMGFAVPAALASWLQEPNRPAIAITGDGGMMMSLAELSTAARLGANLTVVVLNDAALSLIDIKQQLKQGPPLGVRYPRADFATAARGMGCEGWTVGGQDPLEFALAEAFEADGPALVDITVDPSGYRDQLIALRG